MDYTSEYQSKLRTPDQAVKIVKSGDWIDYITNLAFPELLDAALAERKEELKDVKIRGNLIFKPLQTVYAGGADCRAQPQQPHQA